VSSFGNPPQNDAEPTRRTRSPPYRLAVCFLVALSATAQSQVFEKITITPAHSPDPRGMRLQVLPDGDLRASAVNGITLLSYAYAVPSNPSSRLSSLPDWVYSDRWDIEAKAPASAMPAGLSDSEAQNRIQQMIRRLLADRFKLVMQSEKKPMSVYALTVASGGPKLQKSNIDTQNCIFDTAPDGCHSFVIGSGHPLNARAIDMDDLARYIENWTDLPVVNHTALTGLFTVNSEGWLPMQLPPPPPNGAGNVDFSHLPTIFTVLGKLGLELQRQEDTLPVYTVERIERPTAN
jgi:uncharacterized protein (TIGR03435 family)